MFRQIATFVALLLPALPATAQSNRCLLQQQEADARATAQETFRSMLQRMAPEVGDRVGLAWRGVDILSSPYRGQTAVDISGSTVRATLDDAGWGRGATRTLQWDWRTGHGRVHIADRTGKVNSTEICSARVRPRSEVELTRFLEGDRQTSFEVTRVTREQRRVSPALGRELGAWRLPWQRKGLVADLPASMRRALARPGAEFTLVTHQIRSSEQPQASLPKDSRPPSKVTRSVNHWIVVGDTRAQVSAAGARALRSR